MAISNLTGQKTYQSFRNLMQISSSGQVYDGLGNLVTSLQLTASFVSGSSNSGGTGAGFPFSGSAVITGSLLVSSSLIVTGSLNVSNGITGSLFGTASNVQGGTANYIPLWNTATSLSTSSIYQDGTGNIGIGTTVPSANLDVTSLNSTVAGADNLGLRIINPTNNNEGAGIGFTVSTDQTNVGAKIVHIRSGGTSLGDLAFYTKPSSVSSTDSTVERMRILSSGNVGIGETSPSARLHIASASASPTIKVGRAVGNSSIISTDPTGYLALDSNGAATIINHYTSNNVWLATGGGNVGIGATNPGYKLHITGSGTSGSFNADGTLIVSGSNVGIGTTSAFTYGGTAKLSVYTPVAEPVTIGASNTDAFNIRRIGIGHYQLSTTADGGNDNGVLQLQPYGLGKVSIGKPVAGANAKLDVSGSVIISGSLNIQSTGGHNLFFNTSGQLGSTTTGAHITISPSTNVTTLSQIVTTNNGLNVTPGANSTTAGLTVTSGSYPAATLLRVGVNTLVVTGSNVGIGTTSPSFRLSVSASSNTDGIQIIQGGISKVELKGDGTTVWGSSADFGRLTYDTGKAILQAQSGKALSLGANNLSDHLYINTSANVGIGTTTPNAKLDVSGSAIISGSLQVSSSIFQYSNNAAILSGSTANIASFNTSSYMAGFFDFIASSNGNARAGTIFTVWNGTSLEYVETSTNDIGSTTNLILSASLSGANVLLQGTSLSGSWSVKTLTRMI